MKFLKKSIANIHYSLSIQLFAILIINITLNTSVSAQDQVHIDSLLEVLETDITDQQRVDIWNDIAKQYIYVTPPKADEYSTQALELSEKTAYAKGKIDANVNLGATQMVVGNYPKSIELFKVALQIAEKAELTVEVAKIMNNIGVIANRMGDAKQALEYHSKSLKARKKIGDQNEIIKSYINIGLVHLEEGRYDTALVYFMDAVALEEHASKPAIATVYNNIGLVYHNKADYPKALEYHFKSLKISEELENNWYIARSYSNIALVYDIQENYEDALEYHLKSLAIEKKIGNKLGLARSTGDVGLIYDNMGEYDKALDYLFESLKLMQELGEPRDLIATYGNIGETYLNKKDYKEASKFLEKGLKASQEAGLKNVTISILGRLAQTQVDLKNYNQAKVYATQTIELSKELGQPLDLRNGSKLLSEIEQKLGNYEKALSAYQQYHQFYDSLLGLEKTKQLSQLKVQYETEKKEQEIKNLSQEAAIKALELKQTNFKFTILGITTILLVLLGIVFYLFNRQKQLTLKQKSQNIEQKLLRAQMNPHFIFNAMTAIQDYMMQGNTEKAGIYLTKFSKLVRQVLDDSRNEFVSLDQEIKMLDNYLSLHNLMREHPFEFNIEVDDEIISDEIAIPPMFAQPFVENAIEHGLAAAKENAHIHIKFSLNDKYLTLSVTDNGSGIEESTQIKHDEHVSHAINITKERIALYKQMSKQNIAFNIQNLSPGTQVIFNLPFQFV